MKWNATYRYSSSVNDYAYVDGGGCYIEQTISEQLRDAEWGKEVVLGYKMYVKDASRFNPGLGDGVIVTMQDGQVLNCNVVGIDFTVHKVYTFTISSTNARITANGTVSFCTKTGGGLDETTLMPIAATKVWGTAVGCNWQLISQNLLAKDPQRESYTNAKYVIYVPIGTEITERLKLGDNNGNPLGEFSAISIERLYDKGVIKIIV